MIKNILKGFGKWIIWILVIVLLGIGILAFRLFVIDKDYNEKENAKTNTEINNSKNNSKSNTNIIEQDSNYSSDANISNLNTENNENEENSDNAENEKNGLLNPKEALDNIKNKINSNTISDNAKTIGQKVINGTGFVGNSVVKGYKEDEEKYDYNVHNFDEWFLMYEGEQNEESVKSILEHLIANSNGSFYARTSVTAVGFGGNNTINYNGDVGEYQREIMEMKSHVTDGKYEISFKYAGIMTYVNEIVITKK